MNSWRTTILSSQGSGRKEEEKNSVSIIDFAPLQAQRQSGDPLISAGHRKS